MRVQDLERRVFPLYFLISLILTIVEFLPKKQNEFHLVDVLSCDINGGCLWAIHHLSIFEISCALGSLESVVIRLQFQNQLDIFIF